MTTIPRPEHRPLAFIVLVLALAIPIWLLSRFLGVIGSLKIPVTDLLLAFTPLIAAGMLVLKDEGASGLADFLKGAIAFRKLAATNWLAPTLLLAPVIYGFTWLAAQLMGHPGAAKPNLATLPLVAIILFVLAVGEEAGWTGYLLDPLQVRFGALGASLIIAVPWWLGHIPSILEIGGSASDLAWWVPGAIALRVLMTWLYNNTGRSWCAVVLFHTLLNVGRLATYPTIGAHYDPVYQATGYVIALIMSVCVVIIWGAGSLSGKKDRLAAPT